MSEGIDKQQIRELLTTIARVSRGDYETRMETSGKHTEFDSVSAGLNMMINEIRIRQEDLEEQKEEINALNASLLKEIRERTEVESLYQTLTENSTTGIYIVQKGKFVFFNEVFRMNSGYSADELLGTNSLDLIHPEDREYVRQCATDMLKGKRAQPYEFRLINKSGNVSWSWEKVTSITYNGERAALGNFVDITERKKTEEQIQRTNKQLDKQNEKLLIQAEQLIQQQEKLVEINREIERANQMKSEFLASMSHELRTPLNAVIGFSELMLDGITGDINDEQRECLDDILNSGQHLLELINEVLDLSKVEVGKMEFRLVEMDVPDAINEAVQTVKPLLDQKELSVNVSLEEDQRRIYADQSRLRQVLLNLLSNATKFTPQSGRIDVFTVTKDGMCLIGVKDNGIGIKKEDQEKIFEVFTQAETIQDETPKGTGLGLTLTRQFLTAMGGEIWLESEYGQGSTFYFTIPFAESTDVISESLVKSEAL
ncbi:MAG: PAS domain S-box protein [Dehalococcoidales bacterium]|nr:MAG: PAS domain S-box protein [Dehalococcoidales bacterium]